MQKAIREESLRGWQDLSNLTVAINGRYQQRHVDSIIDRAEYSGGPFLFLDL
jgi:hypothetical protein